MSDAGGEGFDRAKLKVKEEVPSADTGSSVDVDSQNKAVHEGKPNACFPLAVTRSETDLLKTDNPVPVLGAPSPVLDASTPSIQLAPTESVRLSERFIDLGEQYIQPPEASEENKIAAEDYKNQGNEAMKNLHYSDALAYYTRSVKLDGGNSVYFCNRAAAYIKIKDYSNALRDCQIAVRLQPTYARAYGRMGVTYSNQNKLVDSILCYNKAVELEPSNESYINNLRYSQSLLMNELRGLQAPGGAAASLLQTLSSNPILINMASEMLLDPSMQQMMQNLMSGFQQAGGADQQGANPMDNLLEMGQAIANQIRTANPQLAGQLGVATNPLANQGNGGDANSGNRNSSNPNNPNNL